jgi:hypothetical protein
MCSIPNGFRDTAISLYSFIIVYKKSGITYCFYFFSIGTTAPVGLGLPPWNSLFHFGFFFRILDSR